MTARLHATTTPIYIDMERNESNEGTGDESATRTGGDIEDTPATTVGRRGLEGLVIPMWNVMTIPQGDVDILMVTV